MDSDETLPLVELRVTQGYSQANPWVIQAISGFLSAYFMEYPGFRVLRHADEAASGMHVWTCEIPTSLKVPRLLKRLQADIPPSTVTPPSETAPSPAQYIIDTAI
ncbi:hypothetical protein [Nitrospira lenta]|uniref:Uncharacterized protein n=1 Tax=Nitrospira lenta TaxID=1436998 RepID=A0A330LGX8_9BACT|nr:hypothetical protein [Nitrospira lenta]SPP66423.1 conserved hypothetical protein [Nitrospira lenta]